MIVPKSPVRTAELIAHTPDCRGGLVFEAHRLLYHSTLGLRNKEEEATPDCIQGLGFRVQGSGFRVQGSGFRVHGSGFRV